MRFAVGIEYDGTAYNGWQRQRTGTGVQAVFEKAVSSVADHPVELVCAGRTDTGVHATGQVAHFDTTAERSDRGWLLGINSNLPDDINARWVKPVAEDFHARFDALNRSYEFHILNDLVRSAMHRHRSWWVHQHLDADLMHAAAQCLLGEHDFSSFRAAGCQASTPNREVQQVSVSRNERWITLRIRANAFLQHMVRNITGTLAEIGAGDYPVTHMRDVLEAADRRQAGVAAPPQGLSLVRVEYPPELEIPA